MTIGSKIQNKGQWAESLALDYLLEKGYHLRYRNYRFGHREIDLIMQSGEILVFVEVKFRSNPNYGFPEEFVDDLKEEFVTQCAEEYISESNWKGLVRFDIISILKRQALIEISHFSDAF